MIIRIGSHRAFDKVERVLGFRPQGLFSFKLNYPGSYGLCEVTPEQFELIKNIKMVKKSRVKREDLMECWKTS